MYNYIISITLNYKRIPHTEVAHTNCIVSSLNTYIGKTPVPNFSTPFAHPFIDRKPYYSGSLSLNRSIDPTNISL